LNKAIKLLQEYDWTGNIRELRNVVGTVDYFRNLKISEQDVKCLPVNKLYELENYRARQMKLTYQTTQRILYMMVRSGKKRLKRRRGIG
jgi:transcriptional regulator with AAA-type ATPase domain